MLQLSADERHTLWYLAAQAPPPPPVRSASDLDLGLSRFVEALEPHVAYVTDAARNVLISTTACAAWCAGFDEIPDGKPNIGHWIFLHPHARHVFVHWEQEPACVFLATVRAQIARLPRNPELQAVIEELCDLSPDARRLWDTQTDVVTRLPAQVTMRAPAHTDPQQPDDQRFHVIATAAMLTPTRADDEHLITAFLLPPEHAHPYRVEPCAACARENQLGRPIVPQTG